MYFVVYTEGFPNGREKSLEELKRLLAAQIYEALESQTGQPVVVMLLPVKETPDTLYGAPAIRLTGDFRVASPRVSEFQPRKREPRTGSKRAGLESLYLRITGKYAKIVYLYPVRGRRAGWYLSGVMWLGKDVAQVQRVLEMGLLSETPVPADDPIDSHSE